MCTPSIVYAMLHSCVHKLCAMPCYRITSGTGFIVWYNFFDRSTKLTAELRKVQQEYDVKEHRLEKYCTEEMVEPAYICNADAGAV